MTSVGMVEAFPSVTVMMPVRNEARYIERSLGAVLAQDYPTDLMDVLIVDGMSEDGTRELVRRMLEQAHQRAVLLDNPSRVVPHALNLALRHAGGDIVIRVDGHCEVPRDYVRRCVSALQQTGADCAGGSLVTVGETRPAQATAVALSCFFGVGSAGFRKPGGRPGWVDTVAYGAYRREVFARIGEFDEELIRNQDDEFNFRLTQAGGRIWLDPSIRTVYYSRRDFRRFWRQYFEYGYYKVRVIQKRGGVPSWRHLVAPAFVLGLLASASAAVVADRPLLALAVAGPYSVANLLASVWLAARRGWQNLLLLPLSFAALHVAYGLGFWKGLWDFRSRTSSRKYSVTGRRLVDLTAAAALFLAVSPLFAALALVNRLRTGRWFFRQTRVGRELRPFELLKFQTMVRGAEAGSTVTAATDGRITPYGRILRRLKLDELPQLINVFRGEMGIVGPRPLTPNEVEAIPPLKAQHIYRVCPGLTGIGAIAFVDEEQWLSRFEDPEHAYFAWVLPQKIAIEHAYAQRRNWATDFLIILLTPVAAFLRGLRWRAVQYLTGDATLGDRLTELPVRVDAS